MPSRGLIKRSPSETCELIFIAIVIAKTDSIILLLIASEVSENAGHRIRRKHMPFFLN